MSSKLSSSLLVPLLAGYLVKKKASCNQHQNLYYSDYYNTEQLQKLKDVDKKTHSLPSLNELIQWNNASLVGEELLKTDSINVGYQREFEFYTGKISYKNHLDILKVHNKYLGITKNRPRDYAYLEFHDGACQAMCNYFVEQHFKGRTIPDILSIFGRGYPNQFKEINDKSTLFTGYYAKSNLVYHNESLLPYGFKITESGFTNRFKDEQYFTGLITALQKGAYFCVGHSVFGLHIIVFIVERDGKLVLFDPNIGALYFTKQELKETFYPVISKVLWREENLDVQIFRLEKL
jgi:hypothetical protein